MSFTVCLIDDQLLHADRSPHILSQYQIQDKLETIAPDDTDEPHLLNLKSFIESMITAPDLTLYGYSNPVFYNNNIGTQPAFDVVIFDWEYGQLGQTINVSEELKKLLDESHCQVYIYSHMPDNDVLQTIEEINQQYSHRLHFLQKAAENSDSELRDKIIGLRDSGNFSTIFSRELRINASKSVEKILVRLAHLDIDKFHQMMGTNDEEKKKDLVEFISEKFKNELMQMSFSLPPVEASEESEATTTPETVETGASPVEPSIKELWHYRLYSTMRDKRVRKGDIYKNESNEYILIMTPNCQLVKYHENKTFGILNYCKLIKTDILEETVKRLVLHEGNASARNTCVGRPDRDTGKLKTVHSLINQIGSKESAPFILPYVKSDEANLILFPKMYTFMEIQVKNQDKYLDQDELIGYEYVTSLNEPFLSELIKEIYDKLERNGVPNFSLQVQDEINSILLTSFTQQ